jgi:hypothetical protein
MAGYDGHQRESIKSPSVRESFRVTVKPSVTPIREVLPTIR